ncbi:Uncharacterised protein [Mycobacteroides abscessus subsp. abscessus]|nr:Uncharacterised protein [Mycobacteroides abscessus subsp. abscessus]
MACRRVYSVVGGAGRANLTPTVAANSQLTMRPTVNSGLLVPTPPLCTTRPDSAISYIRRTAARQPCCPPRYVRWARWRDSASERRSALAR